MRKHLLCAALIPFWLLAIVLFMPQQTFADPPQDVVLNYQIKTQTLTVTIKHPSTFTGFHYIKQIKIKKNNELAEKKSYSSQPGKTAFEYTYSVPAAANDMLEVTVFCNIQGHKTVTLTVQ